MAVASSPSSKFAGDFRVSMNPDLEVVISDERTTPKDKILSKHIRMWQVRLNPIVVPESDRFEKVQLTKMEHMLHSCGSSKLIVLRHDNLHKLFLLIRNGF
ncbi:unnamed protein product [Musa acuminata subsp. burmannicoides]